MLATLLALGELMVGLRFGSLRYPQRHGLCSLTFWQQMLDGDAVIAIASLQGSISTGLQITTAVATRGLSIIETTTTTTTTIISMIVASKRKLISRMFFFILVLIGCFRLSSLSFSLYIYIYYIYVCV
ncbi:hypothetical protein PanWU01x14_026790 [Parasponia andersonii]|uniref:Uncharacterized protein n=1 Tax=Parasponia andersonii TaxID=3476 RepID=A0A2P5DW71_PARAD|nr:hypothetical protein PanWU01x14_026790 [Parasponia andersonii]